MLRFLVAALLLAQASAPAGRTTYLFSYFTGNGEDGLHFAESADGITWTPLDGGRSFLAPAVGSRLMRDPSIARGPDGTFHLVWTTGWWDRGIGLAHSKDLREWSEQQFVPVMEHEARRAELLGARDLLRRRARAVPDLLGDDDPGEISRYRPERPEAVARRSDEPPDVLRRDDGLQDVLTRTAAEAKRPEGPYGPASGPISKDWVEGPSVLKAGDSWIVFYDEYREKRYGAIRSRDLKTWEPIAVTFPPGTRHGTAFSVLR